MLPDSDNVSPESTPSKESEIQIFTLQQEVRRLNGELGRLRGEFQEVRRVVRILFGSLTWRAAEWVNRIVARLMFRHRGPTAKRYLEQLLALDGSDAASIEKLVQESSHAECVGEDHFRHARNTGSLLDEQRAPAIVHADDWVPPIFEYAYLAQNDDVRVGVARRHLGSAHDHWKKSGRDEFMAGWRTYRPYVGRTGDGLQHLDELHGQQCKEEMSDWKSRPLLSVLVPVYKVDTKWLKLAVESVINQAYPHWELCIVDDASGDAQITAYLKSLNDDRIHVALLEDNVGIAKSTQRALDMASGDYIALLDHDDELTLDALWLVARTIVKHDPDLVYSDEAKLDLQGNVVEPHFKPDFSVEMIQSQNYISHLGVYRRSLLNQVGGFQAGFEGSQDHEMLLRFLESATSVYHIPRILYYWRKVPSSTAERFGAKDHAWDAGVRALESSHARRQTGATVEKGVFPGTYRVRYPISGAPKVSIIVPFRDQPELLETCLSSVLEITDYQNIEFVGVNNQSEDPRTQDVVNLWRDRDTRVRFLDFDRPFNFSAINNFAVDHVDGDHVLLLNNDIEVRSEGWLTALLEFSQLEGVGAVGGRLLYPDQTLQHAGVILGIGGVAGHSHKYFPAGHHGYFCRPHLIQNVSAVTGACLMVKRALYLEVGGLEESALTVAFNDIDFCLRLMERGYRNVYTPYCEAIHHESKSRGAEDTAEKQQRFTDEALYMKRRHRAALSLGDHFYNPNLTLDHENFEVRRPA